MAGIWEAVSTWAADSRVLIILALIALDLVLGVASALKRQEFAWHALGDFYLTNVIPKLLGYIGLSIVIRAVAGIDSVIGEGAQWVAFGVLAASLVGSIGANFREIYDKDLPVSGDDAASTTTAATWYESL